MIRALSNAATGLEAQQTKIADLSNDLANVNTDGYKRTETRFSDLMYETIKQPGGSLGTGTQSPVGIQTGMGVKIGAAYKNFEQGPAKMTYHPYDLMIEGAGFFPVLTPQNEVVFTRSGSFHVDSEGILQLSSGAKMIPQMTIPARAVSVSFSPIGEVKA